MNIEIIDIIVIVIIFQLLLFSVFLFIKKRGKISNYILAIHLFSQTIGIFSGFTAIQFQYFYNNCPHAFLIGTPFMLLWGPTFYLYVKSVAYINFKLNIKQLLHLIPFGIVFFFLLFTFYPFSTQEKKLILTNPSYLLFSVSYYLDLFIRIQVFVYIILSFYVLWSVKRRLKECYSSISQTNLSWIQFIVIGYALCYIITLPQIIIEDIMGQNIYLRNITRILPYFIFFNIIFFKTWLNSELFAGIEEKGKYKTSKLTKDEALRYIEMINKYMTVNKSFLNPEFTLNQLSEDTKISYKILSQIINEYFNQNFYDYINSLRIEESKKMLLDPSNKKTVLEILYEVGFNTKSVFNVAFKKTTGLTPTEYRKKFASLK